MPHTDASTAPVTLREITADTVRSVLRLQVAEAQQGFVAPNAVSLSQALFSPTAWYRAIYLGEQPAGFVMLDDESLLSPPPATPQVGVWRLMVDAGFQGRGVGRAAMALVVAHVRAKRLFSSLQLSYVPGPGCPEPFYRGLGFQPTGQMDGDEVVLALPLAAPAPALRCVDLGPERLADYLHFFDHQAFTDNPRWAGCYCYFPLHDPQTVQWHSRSGAENRSAVQACVARGTARGVLAYQGEAVVGWCNAGPWSQFPMLHDETPPDAASLGVVFCFVVAPGARGQGVATALLDAACHSLRRQGLAAVVARPLKDAQGAAANHLGPLAMFLKAGFSVEGETAEGEVLVRKPLLPAAG